MNTDRHEASRPSAVSSKTMSSSHSSALLPSKYRSGPELKAKPGPAKVTVTAIESQAPRVHGDTTHNSAMDNYDSDKPLAQEVKMLKEKVRQLESANEQLRSREKDLSDRLSSEAQKHISRGGKFENLSQEGMRLSQLIERYEMLYTQGRLDALDDLDQIKDISKLSRQSEVKPKILLAIVVAAYRLSKDYSVHIRKSLQHTLSIPENVTLDSSARNPHIEMLLYTREYLQSTTNKFDIEPIIRGINEQLKDVLSEYPNLDRLQGLARYTTECARLAWAMCNQVPPLEMECTAEIFSAMTHTRFHNSNDKGFWVKSHVWPALIDSAKKTVLYKGVVIT